MNEDSFRDMFAAYAMMGMLAQGYLQRDKTAMAAAAYDVAEAMLAERKKRTPPAPAGGASKFW